MSITKIKCTVCGHQDTSTEPDGAICSSCGVDFSVYPPEKLKSRISWVELKGPDNLVIRTNGNRFIIDRRLTHNMFGDVADSLSRNGQFELIRKDDKKWALKHFTTATNPTLINGKQVLREQLLEEGMRLSVGKLTLEIIFAWE